jgi:hypothetical protein
LAKQEAARKLRADAAAAAAAAAEAEAEVFAPVAVPKGVYDAWQPFSLAAPERLHARAAHKAALVESVAAERAAQCPFRPTLGAALAETDKKQRQEAVQPSRIKRLVSARKSASGPVTKRQSRESGAPDGGEVTPDASPAKGAAVDESPVAAELAAAEVPSGAVTAALSPGKAKQAARKSNGDAAKADADAAAAAADATVAAKEQTGGARSRWGWS